MLQIKHWLLRVAELEIPQLRQKDVQFPREIAAFALSCRSSAGGKVSAMK